MTIRVSNLLSFASIKHTKDQAREKIKITKHIQSSLEESEGETSLDEEEEDELKCYSKRITTYEKLLKEKRISKKKWRD